MQISKIEFEKLYYSKTDLEVAEILGVKTAATVKKYASNLGLKLKGKGYTFKDDKRKRVKFV